jgi:superoxide dismutase, Cu-Zn family
MQIPPWKRPLFVCAALVVLGCGGAVTKTAVATLQAKSASTVGGTATFTQSGNGEVKLSLTLTGAPVGERAVHIHEFGNCSAADGSSAGSHWNPATQNHGHLGTETAHHAGDIGNVTVAADGTASLTLTTSEWSVGEGDGGTTDVVGKAVVVHNGTDDYLSQPTGDAGIRIGCGVIERSAAK